MPFSFEPLFVCKPPLCLKKILRGDFSNKKEKKSFLHRLVSQETFFFQKGEAPISKAKTENVNDKRQSVMKQAKPARGEGGIKGKISD